MTLSFSYRRFLVKNLEQKIIFPPLQTFLNIYYYQQRFTENPCNIFLCICMTQYDTFLDVKFLGQRVCILYFSIITAQWSIKKSVSIHIPTKGMRGYISIPSTIPYNSNLFHFHQFNGGKNNNSLFFLFSFHWLLQK